MMANNSAGLIILTPKLSDPRKSLTLNVTIGDPARTATSRQYCASARSRIRAQEPEKSPAAIGDVQSFAGAGTRRPGWIGTQPRAHSYQLQRRSQSECS